MAKNETALDRLERTKLPSNEREFTLEEQMDSVSTDDFLDGMSDVAKDNLGHLFQEVTTEEEYTEETATPVVATEQPVVVAPENNMANAATEVPVVANQPTETPDGLFNNNSEKPKRSYRKRSEDSTAANQTQSNPNSVSSNPLLDQLAKDVIDDLREKCYKINRFDDKSMEMIFNYMYNKF